MPEIVLVDKPFKKVSLASGVVITESGGQFSTINLKDLFAGLTSVRNNHKLSPEDKFTLDCFLK